MGGTATGRRAPGGGPIGMDSRGGTLGAPRCIDAMDAMPGAGDNIDVPGISGAMADSGGVVPNTGAMSDSGGVVPDGGVMSVIGGGAVPSNGAAGVSGTTAPTVDSVVPAAATGGMTTRPRSARAASPTKMFARASQNASFAWMLKHTRKIKNGQNPTWSTLTQRKCRHPDAVMNFSSF